MVLDIVFSSELRKNLGETLDTIYSTQVPMVVSKKIAGGTKDFIVTRKDLWDSILDKIQFNVMVTEDENNEYILELKELEILSYGKTLNEAKKYLKDDVIIYAEEYRKNIEMYSTAPNRRHHLLYLLKVWSLNDVSKLDKMFKYIQ